MKKKTQRLLSFLLTLTMLVGMMPEMSLRAQAADPAGAGGEVSIEAEASYPAFVQSETVDGVKITIGAEEAVFPEGAVLSAEKVSKTREEEALEAVEEERPEEQNVAASYTYDIKVLDKDGNEVQPADESKVKVSFKLEEVSDSNLETNIYHIKEVDSEGAASGEKSGNDKADSEEISDGSGADSDSKVSENTELIAEKLTVETEGDTATAETDGFSLYTVEFSYNDLQYVMPGDSEVALSEILNKVSLTGEVTNVEVSSPELFSAGKNDSGEWIVTAHRAFSSEEWMKVTINDIEYKITVTDDSDTMSFADLQAQIDSTADGGTVTLEKDVNWKNGTYGLEAGDSGPLVIPEGKTVTLDLNGHTIDRRLKGWNNGVKNANVITVSGNLTLTDGSADGTGKLTGGNTTKEGGGVFIDQNATFTMEGGSITDCITNSQGGGVNVNGTFNMTGGTISGCTANNGAGGGVKVKGTFNMTGGTISGCTGRGVFVDSGATFTMSGSARIDGCTNFSGGGVYVNGGTFTMNGSARITGCTATNGTDDAQGGGGVYVDVGTFNVSGSPVISGNKKGDKTNNVTLNYNKTITVTGALTDGAEIWVNGANGNVIAKPDAGYILTANDVAKLHSDNASLSPALVGGNVLLKATLPTATLSNTSVEYNGNAFEPTISFGDVTLTNEDYTLSYKKVVDTQETSLSGAPKDAGSYKLVVTGKGTYAGTQELSFTITQKPVTVSGITVKDKIYDGGTTAELITTAAEFTGICEGDLLTVSANGAGTFADENAGESKAVNIDITKFVLGGASAGNYVLAGSGQQSTAGAKIKRRPITITAEDQDMAEGGSIVSDTIFAEITPGEGLTTALVSGHALSSINLTHTLDASKNNMAGTITAAQASIVGAGNTDVSGNYDITYVNGTCKVIPTAVDPMDVTKTDTTLTIAANKTRDFQKYIVVRKGTMPLPDLMNSAWKAGTGSNAGGLVFTGLTRATEYDIYTCTAYGMVSAVTTVKTNKTDPVIDPLPAEQTLTYNGETRALVTEGSANAGTLLYALGVDSETAPASDWSTSVPAKTNAGTYYVWYKVDGDANYNDVDPVCITVTIAKADQTLAASVLPEQTEASYAVTVALPEGEVIWGYEYALTQGEDSTLPDNPVWRPLPAIRDGQFVPENLAPATSYKIWLRLKEDSNHNASAPISKSFTTPAQVLLSYDANGGSGNLPESKVYTAGTEVVVKFFTGIYKYGYTFKEWNTQADGSGESFYISEGPEPTKDLITINNSTVLYAKWIPNTYTVSFNANGGTGTMEDAEYTYDTAKSLSENGFEKTDSIFAGWALSSDGAVVYKDRQSVKNLVPSGEVTLYAVWVPSGYSVSGIVKRADNTVSGAKVKLMRGDVTYGTTSTNTEGIYTTNTDGVYTFNNVPAGTYNIIAEYGTPGGENYRKMTALVEVKSDRTVDDIILPAERVNSAISVSEDAPAVLVGGLDEVAAEEKEEGKEVTVTMTVETKSEAQAEGAAAIKALAENDSAADTDVEVEYLDIKINKQVNTDAATTISETGHVIEMIVPFNFMNRKNCELFRYHDGVAEKFTALSARSESAFRDASFYADHENSRIYIYGQKFSTYAISYETADEVKVTFIENDGTGNEACQTINLGKATALDANLFTRSGYSFSKWNTKADGSGTNYTNRQTVTLYDDLVLYAQWTQNYVPPAPTYYAVYFDMGGHGTAIAAKSIQSGYTLTKPDDPAEEGYIFGGWYTDADCTAQYDFTQPVTKSFTLYAKWTAEGQAVSLNSISINTAPAKTSYKAGESFNPTGMTVSANYTDGSSKAVTGYTYSPDGALTVSDNKITVSYTEGGITCTAEQAITVTESGEPALVSLNSISINTAPAKTVYTEGEKFDPAGMVVSANYTDGSSKAVTGYTYSPDGALTISDNTITVSYTEEGITCTASQSIKVNAKGGEEPKPDPASPIPGSGEARDPQPVIVEGETLYLVKGQTFTLAKGWSCKDKKLLSVSKTGIVKAKNTGSTTLVYGDNEKTIDVSITAPTITSKISSLPVGTSQEIALNCNENLPVLWYSAAPNIATVDQDGTVTGHSKGTAKVTAMINGKAYTCSVKVTEEASLKERDLYLNVKSSKTVKIKGLKKTVWTISENEAEGGEIVKISGAKIKGLKTGDVQLFCEGYVLNVHVEDPAIEGSAKPYKMTLNMTAGEVSAEPVTLPYVEQDVIFKSNKPAVAYIDDDGFIHARSKGSAKITAKINGKTVTITVKVKDAGK